MMQQTRRWAVLILVWTGLAGCASVDRETPPPVAVDVVLVHGAFEDGSAWDEVAVRLRRQGIHVVVPELPLTGLSEDVNALRMAIGRDNNELLLVGHSWGGAVITEFSNQPHVVGLVYVAGVAPALGQSTNGLIKDYPAPINSQISADDHGMLRISMKGMCRDLAPNLPSGRCQAMAQSQRPIAAAAFDERVSHEPRPGLPIWYVRTEQDRAVVPALQQAMIMHMNAHVISVKTGHDAPQAAPGAVVSTIKKALRDLARPGE